MRKEWREGWLRLSGASPLRGDNTCAMFVMVFWKTAIENEQELRDAFEGAKALFK